MIPTKILSVAELGKYIIDLYKSMRVRFPAASIKLADDIAKQVGHTAQNLEAASSVAWLNGYTTEAALKNSRQASQQRPYTGRTKNTLQKSE